jgi:hypothetical protein
MARYCSRIFIASTESTNRGNDEGAKEKADCEQSALNIGGEDEDRTHDLRIANAALSQLSYPPTSDGNYK